MQRARGQEQPIDCVGRDRGQGRQQAWFKTTERTAARDRREQGSTPLTPRNTRGQSRERERALDSFQSATRPTFGCPRFTEVAVPLTADDRRRRRILCN